MSSIKDYSIKTVASPDTFEYRVFFLHKNSPISPFHDIPLWVDKTKGLATMVFEIPKGTQPKLEISKSDPFNPIKQDTKNGKLRYVAWKYPFNYGAFPQTWENPGVVHPQTKAKGDNDPVDAVDISSSVKKTGDVKVVKVLGTYAMIDEGETDWKVVCIDVDDPIAAKLNDASDIETHLPGKLKEVFEFLRDYKTPDGKPQNQFAFDGKIQDKKYALTVLEETYCEWEKLVKKQTSSSINIENTTVSNSPGTMKKEDAVSKLKW